MLKKIGSSLKILKTASSLETLVAEAPVEAATEKSIPTQKMEIIAPVLSDHLYYRARAISAGDCGPLNKNGDRGYFYNGNFDYFPRAELIKACGTFPQKNIFLDHNSSSSLYSIGKVLDSYPVEDPETGEFYLEILGRIDRKLHPELCRKITTGELNSTSMGCSVESSICSVCAHTLHTDDDVKCEHLAHPGRAFMAEVDFPEYNIKKGQEIVSFAINKGITFTEDSIVGVPADPTAVIKAVVANLRHTMSKKASLTKEEQLDLVAQFEKLVNTLDENIRTQVKAEFCGCPISKETNTMSDNITPKVANDEYTDLLKKLSAYDMEKLENYIQHKTRKAEAGAASETKTADAGWIGGILEKAKNTAAGRVFAKTIQRIAEEDKVEKIAEKCKNPKHGKPCDANCPACLEECSEYNKPAKKSSLVVAEAYQPKTGEPCSCRPGVARDNCPACEGTGQKVDFKKIRERPLKDAAVLDPLGLHAFNCSNCGYEGNDFSAVNVTKLDDPQHTGWVCPKCNKEQGVEKTSSLTASFTVNKEEPMKSTWALLDDKDQIILDASLNEIWGDQFEGNQDFAVSEEYGRAIAARYLDPKLGGVEKLADLWDVSYKLKKEANMEKQADGGVVKKPEGKFFTPGQDSSNKWTDNRVKIEYSITEPKPGANQKGPAAPAGKDVKTIYDIPGSKPGVSQKGPAAPKPAEVKTEYELGKPEGKKASPTNPEEKAHEKSSDKVETSTTPVAVEKQKEEEKGEKKESSLKKADSEMCEKCAMPLHECACVAAQEGPVPEIDSTKPELPNLEGPKPESEKVTGSAFDKVDTALEVGEGYSAAKDKESKEIIITKEGKEVKRLPDGFGPDVASVTALLKAVLGLPAVEKKEEGKPEETLSPVEKTIEKTDVHPEISAPIESPSLKASALEEELTKKAAELKAKEEVLNKKAEEIKKFEMEKQAEKFQNSVTARTSRCRRVIEAMLEKNVLGMDEAVLEAQLHEGAYLLDARKAALDASITAKLKELMASDDVALAVVEKTIADIKLPESPVNKNAASRLPTIKWAEVNTQEEEIKGIFDNMGRRSSWQR